MDERHIHDMRSGLGLGLALAKDFSDVDYQSALDEVKRETMAEEREDGSVGRCQVIDERQYSLLQDSHPPTSLQADSPSPTLVPAAEIPSSEWSVDDSDHTCQAEEDLTAGNGFVLSPLAVEGNLRGLEAYGEEKVECMDGFVKENNVTNLSEPKSAGRHQLQNEIRQPVIKVERCDDLVDAMDEKRELHNPPEKDGNIDGSLHGGSIPRRKAKRKNVDALWEVCCKKIKQAQLLKTRKKMIEDIAMVNPETGLVESVFEQLEKQEYYQERLRLKKVNDEKKQAIIVNDGKKEHSVEDLMYLQNVEIQSGLRRRRLNIPCPKVKCRLCEETLVRKKYDHAFLVHGKEYQNACAVCLERDIPDLEAHFRTIHWKDVSLSCHLCSAVFYSAKELRRHVVLHKSVDPLTCRACGLDFATQAELDSHLPQHQQLNKHAKKEKKLDSRMSIEGTCEKCGESIWGCSETDLRSRLYYHKKKKHSVKLKCPLCEREFTFYGELSKHYLRAHTPEDQRPFVCPFENCGRAFKHGSNLKSHQVYHKPPRFKCEKCNKDFYWAEVMRKHKCPAA